MVNADDDRARSSRADAPAELADSVRSRTALDVDSVRGRTALDVDSVRARKPLPLEVDSAGSRDGSWSDDEDGSGNEDEDGSDDEDGRPLIVPGVSVLSLAGLGRPSSVSGSGDSLLGRGVWSAPRVGESVGAEGVGVFRRTVLR
jgi:hypothetical protein